MTPEELEEIRRKKDHGEALVANTDEEKKLKELAKQKAAAHARYMRYYRNIRRIVLRYVRLQFKISCFNKFQVLFFPQQLYNKYPA